MFDSISTRCDAVRIDLFSLYRDAETNHYVSDIRTRRKCINGGFHRNLSGAFHGNHLRRHRKIIFSMELEADNKEEKSTLPLPCHYQLQLFKNPKSNFQVLNEFFIHNMPAQKILQKWFM
ncbi:hypothetical protein AVEN_86511-1 [Araneus ventricosus]|uniref:Uncharacterized protein n=1 Tax=Araneus ventricosus TaxID=182803 RepID=A0A4Y2N331_ARAVE|nr:hypothetical protein AVEN_86511-1 [Araneus ventricosus]